MPNEMKEFIGHAKHWAVPSSADETKAWVKARVLVDQVRLSRLATQNAIARSRESIAETRVALVTIKTALEAALRKKVQRRINALKPNASAPPQRG
jgi:hypothetical protein